MLSKSGNRARTLRLVLSAGMVLPAATANADLIRVKNTSNGVRTMSDLYAFSESNNKGVRTDIKLRGDATDDVNIAAGGTKNFEAPAGTDSFTISWMVDGVEVESDYPEKPGTDVELAMFVSPDYNGELGIAFDGAHGLVPSEGFVGQVVDGFLVGSPDYEWFAFYDTTLSDGFIERDDMGVPISPPFNGVVEVAFNYDILAPAPGSMELLAFGGIVACRRRR